MAQFETVLKNDLKAPVNVVPLHGVVFSADAKANRIIVEVTDGGSPATLTGTVSGNAIRADGVTVPMSGSLSGNRAWVDLPASAYAVEGQLSIIIRLVTGSGSNEVKTTLGACCGYVQRSTTDSIVDPGEIIPSIEDLIDAIDAAVASIPQDYSTLSSNVDNLMNKRAVMLLSTISGAIYATTTSSGFTLNFTDTHRFVIVGSRYSALNSLVTGLTTYTANWPSETGVHYIVWDNSLTTPALAVVRWNNFDANNQVILCGIYDKRFIPMLSGIGGMDVLYTNSATRRAFKYSGSLSYTFSSSTMSVTSSSLRLVLESTGNVETVSNATVSGTVQYGCMLTYDRSAGTLKLHLFSNLASTTLWTGDEEIVDIWNGSEWVLGAFAAKSTQPVVACGPVFMFVSNSKLVIRCYSTTRLEINGAAVNASTWSTELDISGTTVRWVYVTDSGFGITSGTATNEYTPIASTYTRYVRPLIPGLIVNKLPLEYLYQRNGIPTYINNRKLGYDIRTTAGTPYATNFGYFYRFDNAYGTGDLFSVEEPDGRGAYANPTGWAFTQNSVSIANKKILTIGDSVTNRGWYQARIKSHVSSVSFVGTRTSQFDSTVKCEGYSAKKATDVLNSATITPLGESTPIANPFWDGSKCDFGYYVQHSLNNSAPDYVIIEFGLNETSSDTWYTVVSNFVQTIKNYSSSVIVYVLQPFNVATLPCETDRGTNYHKTCDRVVLQSYTMPDCVKIPTWYIMVDEYDYPTTNINYGYNSLTVPGLSDNTHPSQLVGFAKLGDQIYNYLGLTTSIYS